ncbi:hypothetical protein M3Y97_00136100 [Aphelenchoides bicaudatus]|nr:hypothetical protein M3Y97_00136100 [Aphelenchoides bicaudatus]
MVDPMDRVKVSHMPDPTARQHLPALHLDTRPDTSSSQLTVPGGGSSMTHSPSIKSNLRVPKRRYSVGRQDSLEQIEVHQFSKTEMKLRKKGPSSPATVLSMAGLFICGLLMMISGLLVLIQQNGDTPFEIAGSVLLATGFIMLLTCLVLQRKNLVKYILDLNRDLYFLKINESPMFRFIFDDPSHELPSPN